MKRLCLNRSLVWKEWKQNWWKFWAVGVLMSMTPVLGTIFILIIRAVEPTAYFNGTTFSQDPTIWSFPIAEMVHGTFDSSSMGTLAVVLALGLGAVLLAQERHQNTLEFLVATPVSRREIAATKFLVGAGTITGIMLVNLLFIVVMALILPARYTNSAALVWFGATTPVLLAAYALGFLVAAVTGSLPASFVGALGIMYLPKIALPLLEELLTLFGVIPYGPSRVPDILHRIERFLSLPDYIQGYHYGQVNGWLVPGMLLAAAAFFLLAVYLFERNPLERTGQILMFGNTRAIFRVGISLFTAALASIITPGILGNRPGAALMLGVFLGTYALCSALILIFYKVQCNLG
ncbi:MAG: ABC transporter permease subunit [Bacillota bacterium]|nr:ABC transporter permease subunit [Bacillota bacterium]